MNEAELEAQRELRERLIGNVQKSIQGAPSARAAAEYVTNRLTVHQTDLLAEVAVFFARDEVLRALESDRG